MKRLRIWYWKRRMVRAYLLRERAIRRSGYSQREAARRDPSVNRYAATHNRALRKIARLGGLPPRKVMLPYL